MFFPTISVPSKCFSCNDKKRIIFSSSPSSSHPTHVSRQLIRNLIVSLAVLFFSRLPKLKKKNICKNTYLLALLASTYSCFARKYNSSNLFAQLSLVAFPHMLSGKFHLRIILVRTTMCTTSRRHSHCFPVAMPCDLIQFGRIAFLSPLRVVW